MAAGVTGLLPPCTGGQVRPGAPRRLAFALSSRARVSDGICGCVTQPRVHLRVHKREYDVRREHAFAFYAPLYVERQNLSLCAFSSPDNLYARGGQPQKSFSICELDAQTTC